MKTVILTLLFILPLLITAYTDYVYYKVYNIVTIPLIICGLAVAIYEGRSFDALAGAVIATGILFVGCYIGGVGGGDLKLATGIGVWVGPTNVLYIIVIASLISFVWGMAKLNKKNLANSRIKTLVRGVYLRCCGVKGMISVPTLEDENAADEAVPYGTCLALVTILFVIVGMFR